MALSTFAIDIGCSFIHLVNCTLLLFLTTVFDFPTPPTTPSLQLSYCNLISIPYFQTKRIESSKSEASEDAFFVYSFWLITGQIDFARLLSFSAYCQTEAYIGDEYSISEEWVHMAKLNLLIECYIICDYIQAPLSFLDLVMSCIIDTYREICEANHCRIPLGQLFNIWEPTCPATLLLGMKQASLPTTEAILCRLVNVLAPSSNPISISNMKEMKVHKAKAPANNLMKPFPLIAEAPFAFSQASRKMGHETLLSPVHSRQMIRLGDKPQKQAVSKHSRLLLQDSLKLKEHDLSFQTVAVKDNVFCNGNR
ncbi:uncharacterized protein RAG0_07357 [Rhynchosporium agropyri]|uniref:Uncharacterized protein n=1 Tax=Rhynchosporium agropyri TaxID=914238 RepID=A0A1E1KLC3_9HELO|nr:uncharacterized protein RAG0_07357 [Rhynchosporium agropyri]